MTSMKPVDSVGLAGLDQINSIYTDKRDEAPVACWEIIPGRNCYIKNAFYIVNILGL